MSKFRSCFGCFVFSGILSIAFCLTISAQSTLFNIPSTDTLEEKFTYVEADYITHFGSFSKGGFRSGGYRMVYGAKKNLEIGINGFHTQSEGLSRTELQPNIKWRYFRNEKHKFAASTGAIIFVPLNRQTGRRPATLVYSNISKGVNFAGGMRLTTGIYRAFASERQFGTKTGAIVGVEKPINKKFTFIADWYSGKNRFGYSAAGVNFQINHKNLLFSGYNFGNSGRANNALTIFYGYTF
jgi:hypothetical protein